MLVVRRMRAEGLNWARLTMNAEQVIVFGSYALSAHSSNSDLDVLCVGEGKTFKSSKLHIIWIPRSWTQSKQWLGSELATHIAAYGKWIKGNNDWAFRTKPSRATIANKRENIIDRLKAAERHWNNLLPTFQRIQLLKMRRDLQRYKLMQQGQAPVPKTLLDSEWRRLNKSDNWVKLLNKNSDVARRMKKFLAVQAVSKVASKV